MSDCPKSSNFPEFSHALPPSLKSSSLVLRKTCCFAKYWAIETANGEGARRKRRHLMSLRYSTRGNGPYHAAPRPRRLVVDTDDPLRAILRRSRQSQPPEHFLRGEKSGA